MSAKKISRRVREEAIEACLVAHDIVSIPWLRDMCSIDDWVGDGPSASLAWDARAAAIDAIGADSGNWSIWSVPYRWLEAAALLRDGWSPGDPVEVLR